jgi:hypothetical protein
MSEPLFISFDISNDKINASLSMQGFISAEGDIEKTLDSAKNIYGNALKRMNILLTERKNFLNSRKKIPARLIWQIGDEVFHLNEDLLIINLQIDNIYFHLIRDLGIKRKWLEKVIIFRRYLPDINRIPETLNWGAFEKGTRKKVTILLKKGNLQ